MNLRFVVSVLIFRKFFYVFVCLFYVTKKLGHHWVCLRRPIFLYRTEYTLIERNGDWKVFEKVN